MYSCWLKVKNAEKKLTVAGECKRNERVNDKYKNVTCKNILTVLRWSDLTSNNDKFFCLVVISHKGDVACLSSWVGFNKIWSILNFDIQMKYFISQSNCTWSVNVQKKKIGKRDNELNYLFSWDFPDKQ